MFRSGLSGAGTLYLAGVLFFISPIAASAETFADDPRAYEFARQMQEKYGLASSEVLRSLAAARRLPSVLRIIQRQPEDRASWLDYRARFVNTQHFEEGQRFMRRHQQVLAEAQAKYGVPASIITAIIGVESNYGRFVKTHRALDALATLAFSTNRRAAFFRDELEHLFLLADMQIRSPLSYRSSFVGAIGWGQFLPSSYRRYGTDFNDDGKINLQDDAGDIIGSVANYLAKHGWQKSKPILVPATLKTNEPAPSLRSSLKPDISVRKAERVFGLVPQDKRLDRSQNISLWHFAGQETPYWMGLDNFYVLSRYNRSSRYVMAIFLLSQALEE